MSCTTHAPTHAQPSLPVNPYPILTPPDEAPSGLHDTAHGLLNLKLNQVNWEIDIDDEQEFWNEFESKLINVVDDLIPLKEFALDVIVERQDKVVKNKINK